MKAVEFGQEFMRFSFVIEDGKRVVNKSKVCWKLLDEVCWRLVDDTFAIFDHEAEAHEFLTKLNRLHPFLKFAFEKQKGKCLPFRDVYVKRTDIGFETSLYRKSTFTGQYLRWESFSPLNCKISLISTLVHRALKICTKRNVQINHIKHLLTLDLPFSRNIATDESVTKSL